MSRASVMPATLSAPTPLTPPQPTLMPVPLPQSGARPLSSYGGHPPAPPTPTVRGPMPSEEVLSLPPAEAALALLKTTYPDGAERIRQQQAGIDAELDMLIETARVGRGVYDDDMRLFACNVAEKLRNRDRLDDWLRRIGETPPDRPDIASEVTGRIRKVRRFARNLKALKDQRGGSLAKIRAELRRVDEEDYHGLRDIVQRLPPPGHENCPKLLAELEGRTARRQDLKLREKALDGRGDQGRAVLVSRVIKQLGGVAAVAKALPVHQVAPSAARLPAAQQAVADLDARIEDTDPESRLWASLQTERQQAQAALERLRQRVAEELAEVRTDVVQQALSGSYEAIGELADALRPVGKVEWADSVEATRDEDGVLVAIVAELIRDEKGR